MNLQAYNPDIPIIAQYPAATVIGLGATGFSVVRYLRARGLQVQVLDSRTRPPHVKQLAEQYPEVSIHLGEFDQSKMIGSALVVASPGVSLAEPVLREAKRMGARIIGDIELFIEENHKPLIAITGSNGKSTVTTLVGSMCSAGGLETLVAGNIGLPALDALTDQNEYDVAVLELSSFQLETTSQVPAQASAILNISADHQDRYQSMGDYVLAKARILRSARRAILPRHDEHLQQITTTGRVLSFALDEPANESEYGVKRVSNQRWLLKGSQRLIRLKEIPLIGLHNVKNVLAAYALVNFLNLPNEQLADAVRSFQGLAHRMQTVQVHDGITWVNDSKATNIGATSTALQNLEKKVVWIAGGQGKGADFSELRTAVNENISLLILMGEDANQIQAALADLLPIKCVDNMQQAVELADRSAGDDSIVLLSPACASFDMYQSYEHRGNDFTTRVQAWTARSIA